MIVFDKMMRSWACRKSPPSPSQAVAQCVMCTVHTLHSVHSMHSVSPPRKIFTTRASFLATGTLCNGTRKMHKEQMRFAIARRITNTDKKPCWDPSSKGYFWCKQGYEWTKVFENAKKRHIWLILTVFLDPFCLTRHPRQIHHVKNQKGQKFSAAILIILAKWGFEWASKFGSLRID